MEERKLNLNIPLLSVRRSSTPTRTAPTKVSTEEKGKKNNNSQLDRRRTLTSCKASYILEQVTEPVAVPFNWEKIPGRPKDGAILDSKSHETASATRRIPPRRASDVVKHIENKKPEGQDTIRPQIEDKSFNDYNSKLDCSKEGENEKAIMNLEDDDNDDGDVYSDALDTLSPVDSSSMNCSVSDVSGFDVVKSSGTSSTDRHIRDFMLNRFLPAAKAMTLEPPHYASKKKPVSGEQPRQIIKVIPRDRTPPVIRNESWEIPQYDQDKEDEESEEECVEYPHSGSITAKGCGFLPRLCVKNSLYLLNPVPGMKLRNQSSRSSNWDIKKLTKSAFSRSQSPTLKKPAKDAVSKPKQDGEVSSPGRLGVENRTGGSNGFTYAADRQMISRTSPFRRSTSPYRSEGPQSSIHGKGFQGIPKEVENLKATKLNSFSRGYSKSQELVPYNSLRRGSRPASPLVERTLYVDTVNVAGTLFSNSGSSKIKNGFADSAEKDMRSLFQEIAVVKSSFRDLKCMNIPGGDVKLENKGLHSVNPEPLCSDAAANRDQAEMKEDRSTESKALICISPTTEGNEGIRTDQTSNRNDAKSEKTSLDPEQLPIPPLLPKTPSESWLWRTLPSLSSQNQSSNLYRGKSFQSKRQDPKTSTPTTKWENIVKSSYLHHDHVRYSEELLPHASQQSKN